MKPALWQRLDIWARGLMPFGLTLVLVLISVLPTHVPGLSRIMPLLGLMAIYHWAVNGPQLMPLYAVFLIGLLQDSLSGGPLGVHIIIYLIVYGGVSAQRRFLVGKSFAVIWLGFALVAAGASIAGWGLVSLYHVSFVDPGAAAVQYLLSLGVFPLLAWVFMRWQQAFLTQA